MKFKAFLLGHKSLIKDIAISTCLIGATAGIVFGVSAGTFTIKYMDLNNAQKRLEAALSPQYNYYVQDIESEWNMNEFTNPDGTVIEGIAPPPYKSWVDETTYSKDNWEFKKTSDFDMGKIWQGLHPCTDPNPDRANHLWDKHKDIQPFETEPLTDPNVINARYNYTSTVIDGTRQETLDRSFNESQYTGLVDFTKNTRVDHVDPPSETDPVRKNIAHSYKPSQDTTTEFINLYLSVMREHDVIGLAGFSHTTPLNALMSHKPKGGNKLTPLVYAVNDDITKMLSEKGIIMLDSNVHNNQNIASVQFRADQGAFLSALATCQYFYNNLDTYHKNYENISIGMFGGVPMTTVTVYMGGFQRGIEFFNRAILKEKLLSGTHKEEWSDQVNSGAYDYFKNIPSYNGKEFENLVEHSKHREEIIELKDKGAEGLEQYKDEYRDDLYDEFSIKSIDLGGPSTHFTGTFSAGDAIGISKQFLNRGASAIVAVAGPQSLDAAQEIANQHSKCIVIGVDSPMEDSDYQRYHAGCSDSTRTKPNLNDPYVDKTMGIDSQGNPNPEDRSAEANAIIKFSAIKDIRTITTKITRLCASGLNWDVSTDETDTKPDPLKSVCGPGFQTCANILNGLVSISWDGFCPLLQALCHLDFDIPSPEIAGEIKPFTTAWKQVATEYINNLSDDEKAQLGTEYCEGVKNINNLLTFNKTKKDSTGETTYYVNFNTTIKILGNLMDKCKYVFTDDLTLKYDETNKTYRTLGTDETLKLSLNEWLDLNMYMTD